ncbi:MAG: TauD/TfdA family dioxygenase [Marinomonas sp.]|uniref:TauD/TfdA family dioxygenase n=1 Tax=unclassified Marinomonas TaxID=196814 RepID=UPI0005F9C699|nr:MULTISPECIES: TauD/TfdA family dioxygenase [unclassified Marinomonas]KJZ12381.1 SyrP [Marinomonas sp. S3726]KZM45148.1 SyrP [Marinomonas sp. SBI22]KZM46846.1 SyrP [Marinomonas sp. SBI8L]
MSVVIGKLAEQKQVNGLDFPLMVTPSETQKNATKAEFLNWISENKAELHEYLIKHGAVLLRGFPLDSAAEFEKMLDQTDYKNMPYVGGAAPREQVTASRIVTANESPATEKIPFHHEMAQVPTPPGYIFFYCETASPKGGATSILHSGEICKSLFELNADFASKIEKDGVRYVRVMPEVTDNTSAIGRSWKDTFQVTTKDDAEEKMKEAGMSWEWLDNGDLRTQTNTLSAIRFDEETQQKVFFNSVVAVYTGWNDSRNTGKTAVETGKGELMDEATIDALVEQMDDKCVNFKWQNGDVLWVNNHTVLHARQPFEGDRRILASISFK